MAVWGCYSILSPFSTPLRSSIWVLFNCQDRRGNIIFPRNSRVSVCTLSAWNPLFQSIQICHHSSQLCVNGHNFVMSFILSSLLSMLLWRTAQTALLWEVHYQCCPTKMVVEAFKTEELAQLSHNYNITRPIRIGQAVCMMEFIQCKRREGRQPSFHAAILSSLPRRGWSRRVNCWRTAIAELSLRCV